MVVWGKERKDKERGLYRAEKYARVCLFVSQAANSRDSILETIGSLKERLGFRRLYKSRIVERWGSCYRVPG